jgi:iron complex transport system substrate-binding protein
VDATMSDLNTVTGTIVDAAYNLHKGLGPGLLESVYELVLAKDLERRGLRVARQVAPAFDYDGMHFENAFRIDLLVEECVVVEIKSVEAISPVHTKQVLTYLRLMNLRVGLLLNFGAPVMKDGIRRVVNNMND